MEAKALLPLAAIHGKRPTMEVGRYDILRREDTAAVWLETSADLNSAKCRAKEIVAFWPGRYEVVDHRSQQIVATVASPTRLGVALALLREYTQKASLATYGWLLSPVPLVAGLAIYTRMQKYTRDWYRTSHAWLCAPAVRVRVNRPG